jgi:hypothetical protein
LTNIFVALCILWSCKWLKYNYIINIIEYFYIKKLATLFRFWQFRHCSDFFQFDRAIYATLFRHTYFTNMPIFVKKNIFSWFLRHSNYEWLANYLIYNYYILQLNNLKYPNVRIYFFKSIWQRDCVLSLWNSKITHLT